MANRQAGLFRDELVNNDNYDLSQLVLLADVAESTTLSQSELECTLDEINPIMCIGHPSKRARIRGGNVRRCGRISTRRPTVPSVPTNATTNQTGGRHSVRVRGGRGRAGRRGRPRGGRGHSGRGGGRGCGQTANKDGPRWEWEEVPNGTTVELSDFPFEETEGLRYRMNPDASVLDYFQLYITDRIFEHIVVETNRYASQFLEINKEKAVNTYYREWTEVTASEIKEIIRILLLMGIIYKPQLHMYWSTKELYSTPVFSELMTRNRFDIITTFLDFNDNNNPDYDPASEDRDRLYKVRPLIAMLRERFRLIYSPGRDLRVDESLVLFKGCLKFKQYIWTKRSRFRIKLYELCTFDGITLDVLVYCGKGMFHDEDPYSNIPSTERIPQVLMQPYLGKGHILYTDNYYTSPALADFFINNCTHLCGTIKNKPKKLCERSC